MLGITVVFLSLAPLCRYPNTHPNPLQNPLGVCVAVYTILFPPPSLFWSPEPPPLVDKS